MKTLRCSQDVQEEPGNYGITKEGVKDAKAETKEQAHRPDPIWRGCFWGLRSILTGVGGDGKREEGEVRHVWGLACAWPFAGAAAGGTRVHSHPVTGLLTYLPTHLQEQIQNLYLTFKAFHSPAPSCQSSYTLHPNMYPCIQ